MQPPSGLVQLLFHTHEKREQHLGCFARAKGSFLATLGSADGIRWDSRSGLFKSCGAAVGKMAALCGGNPRSARDFHQHLPADFEDFYQDYQRGELRRGGGPGNKKAAPTGAALTFIWVLRCTVTRIESLKA